MTTTRNQFLSAILETTPYAGDKFVCENRGSGIPTIKHALQEAGMYPAEIETHLSYFKITFFKRRRSVEEKTNWSGEQFENQILPEIRKHHSLSLKEMIELSGLSRATIYARVKKLVDAGLIEPTETKGSPKQRYRIVH